MQIKRESLKRINFTVKKRKQWERGNSIKTKNEESIFVTVFYKLF